jgi:4'-phosphopantetheinyl transferase
MIAGERREMTALGRPTTPSAWDHPPPTPRLPSQEMHVWLAAIDGSGPAGPDLVSMLSPDELARADRYHFARDRDRFISRRGILRSLAGAYLRIPPNQLRFRYGSHGKPSLADADGDARGLRFNLSSSHGTALFAFVTGRELGVDIELVDRDTPAEEIAGRFFSAREVEDLLGLAGPLRAQAFFRCWARKEAYLKARGDGLSLGLDQFDVTLRPGEPAALRSFPAAAPGVAKFDFAELPPVEGFEVALCVAGGAPRLRCWRWVPR